MKPKPIATFKHTSHAKELNKSLQRLQKSLIFVGIAAGSKGDSRKDGPANHLLGFVHEHGSPAANIPARPFLVPGVKEAKDEVKSGMEATMRAALNDDEKAVKSLLDQTGMKAVSAVKNYMRMGNFEPLKPSTIKNRNRSRLTKGKRQNEKVGQNIKPLVNTGALRDALDYYVEDGSGFA